MVTIWVIVGIVSPLVLAIGLSFLGLNPPEFRYTRWFTWIAFSIPTGWALVWLLLAHADTRIKVYTLIGVGVENIIGLPWTMIFIGRREALYIASVAPINSAPRTQPDDLSLKSTDPRLAIIIQLPQEATTVEITVKNVGSSDAHDLHLADFMAATHTISFPQTIRLLAAGETTPAMVPRVNDFGTLLQSNIELAMKDAWKRGRNGNLPSTIIFPATAVYSDANGNHFRASWEYRFFPYRLNNLLHENWERKQHLLQTNGPYLAVSSVQTERLPEWAEG
jgi:hypothetical protein